MPNFPVSIALRAKRIVASLIPSFGLGLLVSSPANAFEVGSSVSTNCHESMTMQAFVDTFDEASWEDFDLPAAGGVWREMTSFVAEQHALQDYDLRWQYLAMSLYAGVRSVDTGGLAVMNVNAVRLYHGPIENMHSHCTRNPEDDGQVSGDVVEGCKDAIRDRFMDAQNYIRSSNPHRKVHIHLDFYGTTQLDVWGPAYELGRAVHTLQDSFSHSIRSEDLTQIWHVVNFIDAIERGYDETRDGFRHSSHLDQCDVDDTQPLVEAATQSTGEAILTASDLWYDRGSRTLDADIFDPWMTYTAGCESPASRYCDSPWIEVAQQNLSHPYVGCQMSRGDRDDLRTASIGRWGWLIVGLGFGLCLRRVRYTHG